MLKGKKTYIITVLGMLGTVGAMLAGEITTAKGIELIVEGLIVMAGRNAIG
jgi:hypothetical protein